jgi:hypothetical protein
MLRAQEFNRQLLESTRAAWNQQVASVGDYDESVYAGEYDLILSWVSEVLNDDGGEHKYSHAYGLVPDDGDHAKAILKLTHARPHSNEPWLKVLNIYLEPKIDVRDRQEISEEQIRNAERCLSRSITESLRLTHDDLPAESLKIYGRGEKMQAYLDRIIANLPEGDDTPDVESKRYGAWLEIENVS